MTLPRMDSPALAAVRIDRDFWHPLGMESSGSFAVNFGAALLTDDDLIGAPGDLYRDPLFYGGAIRFAAVQAGAIPPLASPLHRMAKPGRTWRRPLPAGSTRRNRRQRPGSRPLDRTRGRRRSGLPAPQRHQALH